MLATLTTNSLEKREDETERLLLYTTPPEIATTMQSSPTTKMLTTSSHDHSLHERYKRTSISKPLYAELEENQFRLLRIVPGTRRGEFTAQMFETDLTEASGEYEYSILTLAPRAESEMAPVDRRRSSLEAKDDLDLTYFPILSLGGGEHQIEIPSKVKRALECVVEARWDCFHSRDYDDKTRRHWKPRPKEENQGKDVGGSHQDGTGESEKKQVDEEVEASRKDDDEDGESDTGEGEDFYLWIQDICVDRTDLSDQRQQDKLLGKICEGAKEIILANVPHDVSGRIDVERLENLGSATSLDTICDNEAVQEAMFEMIIRKQIEEGKFPGGLTEEQIEIEVQARKGPIIRIGGGA